MSTNFSEPVPELDEEECEVVLVVGASSDIGIELIHQLQREAQIARSGPRVIVLAHCNKSRSKIEERLRSCDRVSIVAITADLTISSEVDGLLSTIRTEYPAPCKIVYLAAPKFEYARFRESKWSLFEDNINIQLRPLVAILQSLMPYMVERQSGKIVVALSSVTLGLPPGALSHYVSVKYAVLGLLRSLTVEYAPHKISINAVSPSMVETAFLENIPTRMIEIASAQSPWRRNGTPNDVANVIKFLLTDAAEFITGANIPVSGGTAF